MASLEVVIIIRPLQHLKMGNSPTRSGIRLNRKYSNSNHRSLNIKISSKQSCSQVTCTPQVSLEDIRKLYSSSHHNPR